ncbi:hypothetical protein TcCL_NonESM00002 [Trypanosoma cruzi]|nr:hypothetical protein TcCL_Unassigned04027 [Trypanosoma cruzi]RNC49685.1 hypothetical protein TcCL_NonESM00002 [Trypanosoma cruzi]
MAASHGCPDSVHDTKEPRQTTWQRYDRQPSSASEGCWCWWCVSGVESSPVARSQGVVSRLRKSALHSRQRHQARTTYTTKENKEARQNSNTGKRVPADCTFRLAHRHPDGGRAAALRCVWRVTAVDRGDDERGGRRSAASSISINCDTGDIFPSHRLQQRPSSSAAVGAFLLPLGRNSTNAIARLLPHQHNEGATAKDERRTASAQSQSPTAAAMAKQGRLQGAKRRMNTPSNALAPRGSTATDTRGEAP